MVLNIELLFVSHNHVPMWHDVNRYESRELYDRDDEFAG